MGSLSHGLLHFFSSVRLALARMDLSLWAAWQPHRSHESLVPLGHDRIASEPALDGLYVLPVERLGALLGFGAVPSVLQDASFGGLFAFLALCAVLITNPRLDAVNALQTPKCSVSPPI